MAPRLINVLVVDDHPAVRAGLHALINAEPDMCAVGEAGDEFTLAPAIRRFGPDVVLLDFQMPGTNGIALCRCLKSSVSPPRVVIYSSFVSPSMALPAQIACADALVDKAVPPRELAQTIRRVVGGESVIPDVTAEAMALATELVRDEDLPIVGMLTRGVPRSEVAATLRISAEELDHRTDRIIDVLA